MQKCDKCNSQFSWKRIIKSFTWSYKPIHCDNCGTKHEITFSGRFAFVGLSLLPFFIITLYLTPFNNYFLNFIFAFPVMIVGFLLTPYFVKYKAD